MAIWDWPTASCFTPREVQVGVRTPKAGWQAAFSGDRTRLSHLGDRLRMTLRLPGCTPAEGAVREAFVTEIVSAGHQVRLGRLDRPQPAGTLRGAPVVAVAAAAGARSVQVSNARSGSNLARYDSFELDVNGDGLADGWGSFSVGATGAISAVGAGGNGSVRSQQIDAAALGTSGSDRAGVFSLEQPVVVPGSVYSLSVDVLGYPDVRVGVAVNWFTAAAVFITQSVQTSPMPVVWQRLAHAFTAPPLAARAQLQVFMAQKTSVGFSGFGMDNLQFEAGDVATPYGGPATLAAGDTVGALGSLLPVGYLGATLNDAGDGVVPLALPLRRALPAGTPLLWDRPTTTWDLLLDAVDLSYHRGRWQRELELPFQEVP